MKNIKKFLNSIYLGDRFCEKMEIRDDKIILQINCISRLEEGTKEWNYYSQKDIQHGCLVFGGVTEYSFNHEFFLDRGTLDDVYLKN